MNKIKLDVGSLVMYEKYSYYHPSRKKGLLDGLLSRENHRCEQVELGIILRRENKHYYIKGQYDKVIWVHEKHLVSAK